MSLVLVGDVGGTKTLLRLADVEGRVLHAARFESGRYPGLAEVVTEFLSAPECAGARPRVAVVGVAGPVEDGACKTTNLPWELSESSLAARLGLERVRLLNDFEANAHGVVALPRSSLRTLQEGTADPRGPIGVIGAGTGLGEALVVPLGEAGYRVLPTEGSHADFGPRSALEDELLRHLRARFGRVSWERVVSGMGIVAIYEFLRDRGEVAESPAVRGELATEDDGAVIGRHAVLGDDPLCARTMDLFLSAYGAEAGNLALRALTTGGVFVTGGIALKILPLIERGSMLAAFRDKGRMSRIVGRVPLHVVLEPELALLGATRVALAGLLPAVT